MHALQFPGVFAIKANLAQHDQWETEAVASAREEPHSHQATQIQPQLRDKKNMLIQTV